MNHSFSEISTTELFRQIDTREAAAFLSKPPRTLENWRQRGYGPRYVKAGRSVRYRLADILAWQEHSLKGSTVDGEAA